jgi:hypothetical protein
MNKSSEIIIASVLDDRLKNLDKIIEVQCQDGNWNYSEYMHGLANGLICAENIMKEDYDNPYTGEKSSRPFLEAPEHFKTEKIANDILGIKLMTLEELINHPFSKTAMSLGELITKTNKKSVKYVKGCEAVIDKNMPRYGRWSFSVQCNEKWSKGPYIVRLRLLKRGKKTKGFLGREIEVSCGCNAWKYNGADYNAMNKDYSERQYSNGEAPDIRDKKRTYLICKHVATCVPLIKEYIIPKDFK